MTSNSLADQVAEVARLRDAERQAYRAVADCRGGSQHPEFEDKQSHWQLLAAELRAALDDLPLPAIEDALRLLEKLRGIASNIEGFMWVAYLTDDGPSLLLKSPQGSTAATVFLTTSADLYVWSVWDDSGVGGENDQEVSVPLAMYEAEQALVRSGWHNCRSAAAASAAAKPEARR